MCIRDREYSTRNEAGEPNDINSYINHPDPEIRSLALHWLDPGYEYSHNWLEKHQMPLHYQPVPEKNFINNIDHALLFFRRAILDKLNAQNQDKIHQLFISNAGNVELQLKTQIIIDQERAEVYDKLGLVVNKWFNQTPRKSRPEEIEDDKNQGYS